MNLLDNFINECDIALKTLSFKKSGTGRSYPANEAPSALSKEEKNLSAQLMRVNLAGEVAAQALYRGQAMVCKDTEIKNLVAMLSVQPFAAVLNGEDFLGLITRSDVLNYLRKQM